jgi:vancomycin resistance protein VanJ
MKDTFFEKGVGFGSTFRFVFLPLRIDYVLVDQAFEVNGHQVTELPYSDHFPVLVRLNFTSPN